MAALKDEREPVADDEVLVRLVWWRWWAEGVPLVRAFAPKDGETGGISLFRMACLNDATDALAGIAVEKRDCYGSSSCRSASFGGTNWMSGSTRCRPVPATSSSPS